MNMPAKPRVLRSPGPIADAFVRSRAFIKFCIGPVGSGKTMAALQAGLAIAAVQGAVPGPGGVRVRKARIGVIRESYPSLRSTTLKSWFRIIPESEGDFSWAAPFTHKFRKIIKRDGVTGKPSEILDVEFEFRAIGDQTVEEACRGWEVNAVIIDETDLQPGDLIPFLTGRIGRFSDLDPSLVVDPQIICVMNMPDVENHAYVLAMDEQLGDLGEEEMAGLVRALRGRKLIETFIQPGGMEAGAENLHNLPGATPENPDGGRDYYVLQIAANQHKPGYVDRMVHNKPVPLMYGKPVNPGFNFSRHVRPCKWDRNRKLIVGIDAKQTAAAVFLQRTIMGGINTLREVVNRDRKGGIVAWSAETFGKMVRQAIIERFPGIREDQIRLVCDPSAFKGKDAPRDERDWVMACKNAIGFGPIHKAKSNAASLRNEAIWKAQAAQDGYFIDPSCKHLIKAHLGGYRYEKHTLGTGEEKGALVIANTIYTHVADGEQYAALEGEHVVADIRGQARRPRGERVRNVSSYDELRGF
jgi:hypothetical protein